MLESFERAVEIATAAHKGQRDKAGLPYIMHPLSVMSRVRLLIANRGDLRPQYWDYWAHLIAAVLHDVPEDCPEWPLSRIESEGFPLVVTTAIDSVTKRKGECYPDFVRRSKTHAIGRTIKLADVEDNMSRLPLRYEARWVQKLSVKYHTALAILKDDNEWLRINADVVAALEAV